MQVIQPDDLLLSFPQIFPITNDQILRGLVGRVIAKKPRPVFLVNGHGAHVARKKQCHNNQ